MAERDERTMDRGAPPAVTIFRSRLRTFLVATVAAAAIAGVTNRRGNVLGLMPHPERHLRALHHPSWTRRAAAEGLPRDEERAGDGFRFFEGLVRHLEGLRLEA